VASTAKQGDDTALDRTIDSRWPSCHRQGGLGQETWTQESGDGAPSGLDAAVQRLSHLPMSRWTTAFSALSASSAISPFRWPPKWPGFFSPVLGKALYGAAGISEKFTISGFGPANVFTVSRRRTWRTVAVAAPDERRGCSQAICSTGRYPVLIIGTCSPTILHWFYCTEQASGRRGVRVPERRQTF
jgi:hypothetical protein